MAPGETCRAPSGDDDTSVTRAGRAGILEPELLPGATIPVAALLD